MVNVEEAWAHTSEIRFLLLWAIEHAHRRQRRMSMSGQLVW